MPFRQIPSLKETLPAMQQHLALASVIFYLFLPPWPPTK
jgi:hypothetical protein